MPEQTEPDFAIVIDGKSYTLEMNDLELGELELIEDVLDAPVDEIDFRRTRAMRVIAYVLIHREDESFTMDDAKRIKIGAFSDATPPASEPGAKRPTRARKSAV